MADCCCTDGNGSSSDATTVREYNRSHRQAEDRIWADLKDLKPGDPFRNVSTYIL